MPDKRQRPSAALVLGVLSGVLAALIYLPTVFPLTMRVVHAEEAVALRHVASAANTVGRWLDAGAQPSPSTLSEVEVEALVVHALGGPQLVRHGVELPDEVVELTCATGTPDLIQVGTELWAIACSYTPNHRVVAAFRPSFMTGTQVVYVIVLLAIIVGIVTALGVLRLLRPLSQVGRALGRLGAGERGVRMGGTGLAELDDLVERLNAAARAMEDREHAITARIQVVQEMARLVAHEVRNPLQSLELLTSLIASEEDPAERDEIAASIRNEIRALDMVVHRLLREDAAKGALRLHKDVQSVAPLVEQVTSLRKPEAASRGIRLALSGVSWRKVPVDATLLGRSIENLVLNALQAVSPQRGEVRISVYEEASWLCIAVDDNGPGVDPALIDHIFEANVTSKEDGTGLGLTLVKGVVEAHGGYIECGRSALGGARFVARLPFGDVDEHAADGRQQATAHPGGG